MYSKEKQLVTFVFAENRSVLKEKKLLPFSEGFDLQIAKRKQRSCHPLEKGCVQVVL